MPDRPGSLDCDRTNLGDSDVLCFFQLDSSFGESTGEVTKDPALVLRIIKGECVHTFDKVRLLGQVLIVPRHERPSVKRIDIRGPPNDLPLEPDLSGRSRRELRLHWAEACIDEFS